MDSLVAEREHLLLERLSGFGMHDIIDDDVGALFGEFHNDGETDTAIASGDDGCFSFECHRARYSLRLEACRQSKSGHINSRSKDTGA